MTDRGAGALFYAHHERPRLALIVWQRGAKHRAQPRGGEAREAATIYHPAAVLDTHQRAALYTKQTARARALLIIPKEGRHAHGHRQRAEALDNARRLI